MTDIKCRAKVSFESGTPFPEDFSPTVGDSVRTNRLKALWDWWMDKNEPIKSEFHGTVPGTKKLGKCDPLQALAPESYKVRP